MLRHIFIILLLIPLALSPSRSEAKVIEEHIYLVPAGAVDKKIIEKIKRSLPAFLPMSVRVEIETRQNIPQAAYDPSRKTYNAKAILDDILRQVTITTVNERALVIVDVDLYATALNFVFGLADAKNGICIISLSRLKNEFYGLKPDDKLFLGRVLKEATDELGHSWGLQDCSNPKCIMCFSNSLSATDGKKDKFCHDCQKQLRSRYSSPLIGSPSK